jgi:hypothetical protein
MKESIIADIYNGKVYPADEKSGEEYQRLLQKSIKLEKAFKAVLSKKQKKLFKNIKATGIEIETEIELRKFSDGFKLGLLIGIECAEK